MCCVYVTVVDMQVLLICKCCVYVSVVCMSVLCVSVLCVSVVCMRVHACGAGEGCLCASLCK